METNNEKEENAGLRNIQITIETAEHIKPAFDITDISFEVKFKNELLGKSENYLSFEEEEILVDYQISLQHDITTEKSLDELISNPIQFIIWQSLGHHDPVVSETDTNTPLLPVDSAFSLYESNVLGIKEPETVEDEEPVEIKVPDKVTIKEPKKDKTKKKEKAKSNESVSKSKEKISKTASKESKTSNENYDKSKQSIITIRDNEPFVYGCSNLDLEPLILGDTEFTQTLELSHNSINWSKDFEPLDNVPRMKIKISIDKPIFDETRKLENILYFTVETMYNLPEKFPANMNFQLSSVLPTELSGLNSVCIENGRYLEELNVAAKYKRWPNLYGNDVNCDTYEKIEESTTDIKNKIDLDIGDIFQSAEPRIEWNVMKPCWMNEKSNVMLKKMLIRYRLWPIEIYMYPQKQVQENAVEPIKKVKLKTSGSASSKSKVTDSKNSLQTKDNQIGEPLHLMAFADVTNLLYPGVTKTRVTCPVRTFQAIEMKEETGLDNSYFIGKQTTTEEVSDKQESKGKGKGVGKNKDKSSTKGTKGKKDGSKKSDKDKRKKNEEAENKITPEQMAIIVPPPEPSQPLFNAKGEPTFIIIEMELMNPLRPRKSLEDLTNELSTIIPNRPPLSKTVLSAHFAVEQFRECINILTKEINEKYQELEDVETKTNEITPTKFIRYLQANGSYQIYMTTMLKSVATLISEKYNFDGETKNNKIYENFISNIYVHLIDEMNKELNGLMGCNIDTGKLGPQNVDFDYLYCAEEAIELQAPLLAERYILETLGKDTRNSDVWLNYAIYHMGQGLQDQAFECLKESLALKVDHKYSLILFATILYDKEDFYLAETTFLSVVTSNPHFMNGWTCLYMFYKTRQNNEGCDVCWEMINKCETYETDTEEEDWMKNRDGLAWTTTICPDNKKFLQTAMVLIKLRAFKFAELALNCENLPENGLLAYYHGVTQYFLGNYENALENLTQAQKLHGPDYAVNSLIGHCHYRLGNLEEAKDSYEFIVYAFNRPEDMHMLYTNLAMIYEKENNLEMARKYFLIACKLSPTPFSWLLLGAVFYKENNMLSAESCLNESNILDNRLPESWAYLTLVNLKNGNNWEANQCYNEMQKHNLRNESLLSMVEEEIKVSNEN